MEEDYKMKCKSCQKELIPNEVFWSQLKNDYICTECYLPIAVIEEEVVMKNKAALKAMTKVFSLKEQMQYREDSLIKVLNELLEIRPLTYKDLSLVFSVGEENITKLRTLEKNNPKLGLARFDTSEEGFSVLSLIATITNYFCDKRLGVMVEEDGIISRWLFI